MLICFFLFFQTFLNYYKLLFMNINITMKLTFLLNNILMPYKLWRRKTSFLLFKVLSAGKGKKKKSLSPFCFHETLQWKIQEFDFVRSLPFCWLTTEVLGSFYCSGFAVRGAQSGRYLADYSNHVPIRNVPYPSRFLWLI